MKLIVNVLKCMLNRWPFCSWLATCFWYYMYCYYKFFKW